MKFLHDYPAICIEEKALRIRTSLRDERVRLSDAAEQALLLAEEENADAVLIVRENVVPEKKAEAILIDPSFLKSETILGFPARSVVTNMCVRQGAVFVPVERLRASVNMPLPEAVMPHNIGAFYGNQTPDRAFQNGFAIISGRSWSSKKAKARLALEASLGTEALNGCWWVLGAWSALQTEETIHEAWDRHARLLAEPGDIAPHMAAEARSVRRATGISVQLYSHEESRAMKAMLPDWPTAEIWNDFVADCCRLNEDLKPIATRYRRAASRIWLASE